MPSVTHVQPRNLDTLKALIGQAPGALMSGRNVARHSGIHHSFVSLILSGRRSKLSVDVANRIAAALGVKPTVLWRPAPSNSARIKIKNAATR